VQRVFEMKPFTLGVRLLSWLLILGGIVVGPLHAAEKITFYHYDLLGSPVAATNEKGEVLWREEYSPYGDKFLRQDIKSDNLRGFTGHVFDEETGLTYMQARYYDPEIGRFMSVDPARFDETNIHSFNRYAYANNNPYKFVDPDGANAVTAFGGLLYETGQFLTGNGFNGSRILGALKDGYNGEGEGFAQATIGDATTFVPVGAVVGSVARLGKLVKAAKVAKSGQVFERVVSKAELEATQKTGLLRGGRDGENFFTNSASLDAKRAQQRLGLDGPLRDARIRFRIKNNVEVTGPRSAVPGRTGTAGGGREFSTNGRTEIDILRIDPLRR
jgi:RHS repeat-associated protein